MRQLLMLAAVAGLAVARPEVYREKEDFQFSRSSTDEGSKSGYYGAQRGNMGGNYERAHNMDPLAQNQMSGLVRTVEGELGDGAKQPSGSVFTAANTRGVYGSGNYDLRNLAGRNFQEGAHSSQSHSSLTSHLSSGYNGQHATSNQAGYVDSQHATSNQAGYVDSQSLNSGYRRTHDSRYDGYNSEGNSAQVAYSNNHGSDSSQRTSQSEDRTRSQNTGYSQAGGYSQAAGYSQTSGYQGRVYDQDRSQSHTSNGYGSNINTRLVSSNPVKIVIRPGTKVVVPLATQTYDASQSTSAFDQNAINSETEGLNGNDRHVVLTPTSKNYESSYSYRKEWEKHDTKPVVGVVPLSIPTENPYPANNEFYEDTDASRQQRQGASRIASQGQQSSHSGYNIASQSQHSAHSGYNVNSASSSQSRQADHNAQRYGSDTNTRYSASNGAYNDGSNGAYNAGAMSANHHKIVSGANMGTTNGLNEIEDSNTKPKSYHSAYSYHKSWERQGDPYVIKPLSTGSISIGPHTSDQYISQQQTHQGYSSYGGDDCDEHGQLRVARSPGSHHYHAHDREDVNAQDDMGQQTQQQWDNLELGQQTQTKWDEELGQQTQHNWDQFGQQTESKWDKLRDEGQQTQNNWDQFGQQTESKWDKLQDEGQQTQTLWGQQETQNQWDKIEDVGQQAQNQWDQHDVGQQTQTTWDKLEVEPQRPTELEQQTQDAWTTLDTKKSGADSLRKDNHSLNQDHQLNGNTFEIAESSSNQKHNSESHTLDTGTNKSSSHHVHNIWDEIKKEEIGQENEDSLESDLTQAADVGQQTQVSWGNININENSFNPWHQKAEDQSDVLINSQQNDKFFVKPNPHPWMYNQVHHRQENKSDSNKYFNHSSSSSSFSGFHSQEHSTNTNSSSFNSNVQTHSDGSAVMSLWDKLENIEKQTILSHGDQDNLNVEHQDTAITGFGKPAQTNVLESHTTVDSQKPTITSSNSSPITSTGDKVISHDIGRGDIDEPEVSSSSDDIGRGDIEPENPSNERYKPVDLKPYKNPSEIGASSIIKETDRVDKHDIDQDNNKNIKDDRNLSVLSLDQQSHTEHQDKETQNIWQSDASVTTAKNTTQSNNNYMHNENTHHLNEKPESHHNNMENGFENQDQNNLHQQTIAHQFVNSQENQNTNTDQQLVDFGQQSDNFGAEQMEQQYQVHNTGQSETFQQENKKHEAEELGQETEQFDQVSLSGWKPDDDVYQQEHKLWGQENLEQQSQSGWTENLEQQVQTAWEPTYDLQQQSQLTDTFTPDDFSQQVQPEWKPTKDMEQQSQLTEPFTHPIEDLNQQVQTAWKPTEDMDKQSRITDKLSSHVNQNEDIPSQKQAEVVEELIVPKKDTVIDSPPEIESVTEKPGFWKSVGSKFTSAKDKVASWFSS